MDKNALPPESRQSTFDTTELRRQIRINAEKAIGEDIGARRVRLVGGPMDAWLVRDDAAALRPDWYKSWTDEIAREFEPGGYVVSSEMEDGARVARWVDA